VERLFSYGTLQQERVQMETFGRILHGQKDLLPGYRVGTIRIEDPEVIRKSGKEWHPILRPTGNPDDLVAGTVFSISKAELAEADSYEVDAYIRVSAVLKSGLQTWIYAAAVDGASGEA